MPLSHANSAAQRSGKAKPNTKDTARSVSGSTNMTDNLPTNTEKGNSAPKGIEIERLIDYRKKGLTLQEIATLTGCTKQTVSERLQGADLEGLDTFREHKDTALEHKQREIVKSLTGEKINSMSGLQAITAAAILEDKIRNIRQQSTGVVSHQLLVIDLSKAIEAMRTEQHSDRQPVDNSDVIDCPTCNEP